MTKRIERDDAGSEYLESIGLLALEWTWLEDIVSEYPWKLLKLDRLQGWRLMTHIPLNQKFDTTLSLVELLKNDDLIEKLQRHTNHIRHVLRPRRNEHYSRWHLRFTNWGASVGHT